MTTIYLLQGLGQTTNDWNALIEYLPREFTVHTIDSFEIGMADNKEYSLEQAIDILENELTKDRDENKIICGLSLGAVIAAGHAIKYPANKMKYIFNSFHPSPPKTIMAIQSFVFTVLWKIIRSKIGMDIEKKQFLSVLKAVKARDFSQDLSKINQHSCLIVGGKDTLHVHAARSFGGKLPNCKVKVITGAGHEINKEKPEELAELIKNNESEKIYDSR